MFPDEKPKLSENEKKERQMLKQNFGAPHMTKLLMDIGQDLVQVCGRLIISIKVYEFEHACVQ